MFHSNYYWQKKSTDWLKTIWGESNRKCKVHKPAWVISSSSMAGTQSFSSWSNFGSMFVLENAIRRNGSMNDMSRQRDTVVWLIVCRSLVRSVVWFQIKKEPRVFWVQPICFSPASILPSRSGRRCGRDGPWLDCHWWDHITDVGVKQEAGKMVSSRASSLYFSLEEISYTIPPIACSKCILWIRKTWVVVSLPIFDSISPELCYRNVWEMQSFSSWFQEVTT